MIELILAVALILAVDVYVGLSRRSRRMEFRFSRYGMYCLKPGRLEVTLSRRYYNLPSNQDVDCRFEISGDGHLDAIRSCDNVLVGGSAAFGVGSSGNSRNISGHLRDKHRLDVLNLAVPGWNIEQEAITLLRHLSVVNPKKVVFFDGANNLALALPFDYHGYPTSPDPLAFYGEAKYAGAVERHFDSVPNLRNQAGAIAKEMLRHSTIARAAYRLAGRRAGPAPVAAVGPVDYQERAAIAVENYLRWLNVFADVAVARGIEVHCVLQPYYAYGRDMAEAENHNFYRINEVFDAYMTSAYDRLDAALSGIANVTYHPLFRDMACESIGLFTDAVHLNERGYEVIADKLSGIYRGC